MSHSPERSSGSDLSVEVHPAERKQSKTVTAYTGCCCCCCCCFHTVGSLVGAAIGSGMAPPEDQMEDNPGSAAAYYWLSFLGLCILGILFVAVSDPREAGSIILVGGAILLPAFQLGASLVSLLLILATSDGYRRSAMLVHLGKITLWMVVGTVAGIGLLIILFMICSSL